MNSCTFSRAAFSLFHPLKRHFSSRASRESLKPKISDFWRQITGVTLCDGFIHFITDPWSVISIRSIDQINFLNLKSFRFLYYDTTNGNICLFSARKVLKSLQFPQKRQSKVLKVFLIFRSFVRKRLCVWSQAVGRRYMKQRCDCSASALWLQQLIMDKSRF